MVARMNNPGMFQSFWELDEQGVEEESEEEIQSIELVIYCSLHKVEYMMKYITNNQNYKFK